MTTRPCRAPRAARRRARSATRCARLARRATRRTRRRTARRCGARAGSAAETARAARAAGSAIGRRPAGRGADRDDGDMRRSRGSARRRRPTAPAAPSRARGCVMTLIRAMSFTAARKRAPSRRRRLVAGRLLEHVDRAGRERLVGPESSPRLVDADTIRIGVGQCAMMYSVAARPVITGSIMSSVTTSGRRLAHSSIASLAVLGLADDLDLRIAAEDLDQALAHRERVLDDQHADLGHRLRHQPPDRCRASAPGRTRP